MLSLPLHLISPALRNSTRYQFPVLPRGGHCDRQETQLGACCAQQRMSLDEQCARKNRKRMSHSEGMLKISRQSYEGPKSGKTVRRLLLSTAKSGRMRGKAVPYWCREWRAPLGRTSCSRRAMAQVSCGMTRAIWSPTTMCCRAPWLPWADARAPSGPPRTSLWSPKSLFLVNGMPLAVCFLCL